jgi:putative transposase
MREPYTQLYVHLVWSTWDRQSSLTPDAQHAAFTCMKAECAVLKAEMLAAGGTADHVHALVRMPSTVTVADLVKRMKGASSHLLTHQVPGMEFFKWQGAYGAFTISKASVPKVLAYIANQEAHHRDGTTYKDLEIAWDERA